MFNKGRKFYLRFCLIVLAFFAAAELATRLAEKKLLLYDTSDEIETVAKLEQVKKVNPDVVFIGSSRVAMSVNTQYLNEKYHLNSYNFAFTGANQWVMRNYLEWLLREKPEIAKATFVIGIDPDSNFDDLQFISSPSTNRIPKYFGLKQALYSNDIDAETFVAFVEEAVTGQFYLYRYRSAWRNMIFTNANNIVGKQLIPTVEAGRIRYFATDHGYDNITMRLDNTNLAKELAEGTADSVGYRKRFHRNAFVMLPGIGHELEKLNDLVIQHQLKFYIYLPPVWIEKFRTQNEMNEFFEVMQKKLPSNKGFIDLSSIFRGRDSAFRDFQHLRHAATFETADSISSYLNK